MAETLVELPETVWSFRRRIAVQAPAPFERRWFPSRMRGYRHG